MSSDELLERRSAATGFSSGGRVVSLSLEELAERPSSLRRGGTGANWEFGKSVIGVEANQRALVAGRVPRSFLEAYEKARGLLEPAVENFARFGKTTRRKRHYSDEGDELSIERLSTGDPLFWERRKRGAKKRIIRLGVQYGYSAYASEAVFIKNAALATAAADALSLLGYGVQIVAVSWGTLFNVDHHSGEEWVLAIELKAADERLDAQRVLVTGLVAMSRCFEFGVWDRMLDTTGWNMTVRTLSKEARVVLELDALIGQEITVTSSGAEYHSELEGFLSSAAEVMESIPVANLQPEPGMDDLVSGALEELAGLDDDTAGGESDESADGELVATSDGGDGDSDDGDDGYGPMGWAGIGAF